MNYPEYFRILRIDFQKLIDKIPTDITGEIANSTNIIESFKNGDTFQKDYYCLFLVIIN